MPNPLSTFVRTLAALLVVTAAGAVVAQSAAGQSGAKLPLVTAGTVLRWSPGGDEVLFDLPEASWIRLSVYSPGIDLGEVGDERYDGAPLEASFVLSSPAQTLASERFSLADSSWLTLFEGPASAGRHVLRSDVVGNGKNVYLLRLETEREDVELKGYSVTVNASSETFSDAFSFDIEGYERCQLELYDGDGSEELAARLVLPSGVKQSVPVSADLEAVRTQYLPRLPGLYTVQLRLPETRYQRTNSVRFRVLCDDQARLVPLVPAEQLSAPELGPLAVEVIDTRGAALDIPYDISGRFERTVRLQPDAAYTLIETRAEGDILARPDERSVRFGLEGGRVVFVLEPRSVELRVLPKAEVAPAVPLPRPVPSVGVVPARPLERPPVTAEVLPYARFEVARSLSAPSLVACQTLEVTLTVENRGEAAGDYRLREAVPAGLAVSDPGGARRAAENEFVWQGQLAPGERAEHRYRAELAAGTPTQLGLRGVLEAGGLAPVTHESTLTRAELRTVLTGADDGLFVGDEVMLELSVHNPTAEALSVALDLSVSGRLELVEAPATLELPARGSAAAPVLVRGVRSGRGLVQVTPFACGLGGVPAGPTAPTQLEVAELPELPRPRQTTTVVVDMAAFDLPVLDGLVLVEHLPEGARYVAGSARLNGERMPEPAQAAGALVFDLPGLAVGQVSFVVLHEGPLFLGRDDSSLIALTPEPELLLGREAALDLYARAEPIGVAAVVRERAGAVILSPLPGALLRERDRVTVSTDTPLGDEVRLYINGDPVPDEWVGQRVLDPDLGRQTFDYIGVPLVAGPNELALESVSGDRVLSDRLTLYFSGPAERFSLTPLTPLVADSAEPLELDILIVDAWGNAPMDDLLTVELDGARPAEEDASPERVGYQLRAENGHARLVLEPLAQPGTVTVRVLLGEAFSSEEVVVTSNLRPWIVSGLASVGGAFDPGSGEAKFGVNGSFFARGSLFGDYLLTLAARYPFGELGPLDSNPYQQFPVPGSSANVTFDAVSQQGIYGRLERGLSYVQYGDFRTPLEGEFLELSRGYTGLSGEVHTASFALRGYGAYVSVTDARSADLESDGTSLRFLPDAPIKPGSLRVDIIKKDDLGVAIPEDDGDPLTRRLEPLVDFRVDEELGLLELFRPVPLGDDVGRPYVLRVSYTLSDTAADERFLQAGAQGEVKLGAVRFRAGVAQETRSETAGSRVVAAGLQYAKDAFQAGADVAYGTDASGGGVALSTRVLYRGDALSAEASWRFLSEGYRSPSVATGSSAGSTLNLRAAYEVSQSFGVAAGATLLQKGDGLTYSADLLGSYIGRGFDAQFGVSLENSLLRPLVGANLYNPFGWQGSRLGFVHRQGLGARSKSVTQFSAAFPLLKHLNLTLTDELIWGNSNALLLGLEASLDNRRSLESLCRSVSCTPDADTQLGTTTVTAQYELPGGVGSEAGRVRLGLETSYPLSDDLSLQFGAEHRRDLNDPAQTVTVLRAGAAHDTEHADSSLRYEFSLSPDASKHSLSAGSTFALSSRLFASLTGSYLNDSAAGSGLRFGVAGAYRGERAALLSNSDAQFGALAPDADHLTGDSRVTLSLAESFDLRLGYAYRWLVGDSYLDMINLGIGWHAWAGGQVLATGRLFNDWTNGEHALGAGLEVSQRLGCGVYGVAGYNLGGLERDYGSVYGGSGVFVRLDVVFDEQWACGAGEVRGQVYIDENGNGLRDEGEVALAGVRLELFNRDERIAAALSGSDGSYRFGRIRPGAYRLHVYAPTGSEALEKSLELGFGEHLGLDIGLGGND